MRWGWGRDQDRGWNQDRGWWAFLVARSRCPACGTTLGARDLVPLLSWLALGRRCRHCRTPIAGLYPLAELAGGGIGLAAFLLLPPAEALLGAGLGWYLLLLALVDLAHRRLPEMLTLPLVLAGLAAAVAAPSETRERLAGGAVAFALILGLRFLYGRLRGREGMGFADAVLIGAAGLWLGLEALPTLLLSAALLGLAGAFASGAWRDPATPLPFGPAIALAFWLLYLGERLTG